MHILLWTISWFQLLGYVSGILESHLNHVTATRPLVWQTIPCVTWSNSWKTARLSRLDCVEGSARCRGFRYLKNAHIWSDMRVSLFQIINTCQWYITINRYYIYIYIYYKPQMIVCFVASSVQMFLCEEIWRWVAATCGCQPIKVSDDWTPQKIRIAAASCSFPWFSLSFHFGLVYQSSIEAHDQSSGVPSSLGADGDAGCLDEWPCNGFPWVSDTSSTSP